MIMWQCGIGGAVPLVREEYTLPARNDRCPGFMPGTWQCPGKVRSSPAMTGRVEHHPVEVSEGKAVIATVKIVASSVSTIFGYKGRTNPCTAARGRTREE